MSRQTHTIPAFFPPEARLLILGSFPSVKSRETGFYYGHPQNRFWQVLSALYQVSVPQTIPEKKALLYSQGIALWDVIESCEIIGSSDSSIKQVKTNPIGEYIRDAGINRVFANGKTAERLYRQYVEQGAGLPAICLPSTSPANAAWSLERLIQAWGILKTN